MSDDKGSGGGRRFVIILTGFKTGITANDMVIPLTRLYPAKTSDQIRASLERLPLVLARSATEEQARKIKTFLESRGAVLKVGYATPPPVPPGVATDRAPAAGKGAEAPLPAGGGTGEAGSAPKGAERRTKPRVHPGIQVQPMGIGEILDRSFRILRQQFWLFFIVVLIPQVIFFVLSKGMGFLVSDEGVRGMSLGMGIGFGISTFMLAIAFLVLQFWSQGALIFAVSETYLGHETSVKGSYGALRHRLGRLLGTMLLVGLIVVIAPALAGIIMAVLIPLLAKAGVGKAVIVILGLAVLILVLWVFVTVFMNLLMVDKVVVLEDIGWRRALGRSKELMKARTEPGFWKGPKMKASVILLLGGLIAGGIHMVIQVPGAAFMMVMPGNTVVMTLQEILGMAANALATVFTATAMILYYYDIRVRKEGFDLKMMAENL